MCDAYYIMVKKMTKEPKVGVQEEEVDIDDIASPVEDYEEFEFQNGKILLIKEHGYGGWVMVEIREGVIEVADIFSRKDMALQYIRDVYGVKTDG